MLMRAARSLMFVPGHRRDMIAKALGLAELDVALLDLEDGVPPAETANARTAVKTTRGERLRNSLPVKNGLPRKPA